MPFAAGAHFGVYEILSPLGAGGMGEVYRARDTKLGRDVALKILPASFTNDPERVARFRREAQVLASLNHPHIAQIYGLEEANATQFLVLELVDGESLDRRIAQGAFGLDEALGIAKQIAEALEAAHEKGIIHRDLKPANVALTEDGQVKVLDFGLAKAVEATGSVPDATVSPTITSPAMMTGVGVILGTAAYMSPEQAKGRPADKRSDIWAFGCLLYEMLTGRRAFSGEDVSDTLAAVLRSTPDWSLLPAGMPAQQVSMLRSCLEKDRRARIPEIAAVRFLLDAVDPPSHDRRSSVRVAPAVLLVGLVAIAAGAIGWRLKPSSVVSIHRPVRFTLPAIGPHPLSTPGPFVDVAMSPDASRIVYVVGTGGVDSELIVRDLDRVDVAPMTAAIPAIWPFLSPDNAWVGFVSGVGGELKKASLNGGAPISLTRLTGSLLGASWGSDHRIVFSTNDAATGLLSVADTGGEPRVLTRPDTSRGEVDHILPWVLPDATKVLFTITTSSGDRRVGVLDLGTGQYKTVVANGSQAYYVPGGFLVYASGSSLRAVRFDLDRLEVIGEPITLVDQVFVKPLGRALDVGVSTTGGFVYLSTATPIQSVAARVLVWVDRMGRERPVVGARPRAYVYGRLSPDDRQIAVDSRDEQQDIWTFDIARGTLTRVTFSSALDLSPVWTPDGQRIVFGNMQEGFSQLFWQRADGSGSAERLTTGSNNQVPTAVSPDGRSVIFNEGGPAGPGGPDGNIWSLRLDGKSKPEVLLKTPFDERNADISPDGHWMAYESTESGRVQVFVRPYPNAASGRIQVSATGGERPVWSRTGKELFFLDDHGLLTGVPVDTSAEFRAGRPTTLLQTAYFHGGQGVSGRPYDVSRDGKQFLMIKDTGAPANPPVANLTVVLNVAEELKVRLPSK